MKYRISMAVVICLAIAMAMIFTTKDAWSEKQAPDPGTQIQKNEKGMNPSGQVQMPKKTNPTIIAIYASVCPCKDEVEPNGGILMKGVYVRLKNYKCGTFPTTPVSGKVRFKYYCLKDRRIKSITKSFTNLVDVLDVAMIPSSQTILAGKNELLIAEITEIRGAQDCDPSHNTIRIATCVLEPVH
jgi:hypothetical protein